MIALSIPSPSHGAIDLGPIPIRGYALCIVAGIIVAVWLAERRWVATGGRNHATQRRLPDSRAVHVGFGPAPHLSGLRRADSC